MDSAAESAVRALLQQIETDLQNTDGLSDNTTGFSAICWLDHPTRRYIGEICRLNEISRRVPLSVILHSLASYLK
jgi:hypothetical protein